MKFTFDFGNGFIREYYPDQGIKNILEDGGFINIEIKHPKVAEHCIIGGICNIEYPSKVTKLLQEEKIGWLDI